GAQTPRPATGRGHGGQRGGSAIPATRSSADRITPVSRAKRRPGTCAASSSPCMPLEYARRPACSMPDVLVHVGSMSAFVFDRRLLRDRRQRAADLAPPTFLM